MDLENRVAVITGATGALGMELASRLAGMNVRLALLDHSETRMKGLIPRLALPETQLFTKILHLSKPELLNVTAREVQEKFGQVDFLIHLVGGWTGGKTILETPGEDVQLMLDQHLWTSFFTLQAFLPYIQLSDQGRILAISSPMATRPNARTGAYAIGKAAEETLMMTLAAELKGTKVTSNVLQVRVIDKDHEKANSPSEKNQNWATPEEISATVLYLLGEGAGMINGARIPLFGIL